MIKRINILLLLCALVVGLVLGYRQTLPPRAPAGHTEEAIAIAQAGAAPDFQLMLSHIKNMASEVHSVGSPGLARTQEYLMHQLTAMAYDYTVEDYLLPFTEVLDLLQQRAAYRNTTEDSTIEDIIERAGLEGAPGMPLRNIIVSLKAPDTAETIVFMAHTDSVKEGPGAFDDIVSVAALLEGLRSIQGHTFQRNLLFVFTDGEEQGLLGAAKFVEDHPELKENTSLVINLEARGNAGALILFETTGNNLGMMQAYQEAVSHPFSLSIATAVYKTMQNDTDLSRFIMAGYPGINLAAIDGSWVYHTAYDNYDNFSRDSAFHYLDTVVGLVRHLALTPQVALAASQDAVQFPLLAGKIVVLPQNTANLLAFLALGLILLITAWLFRAKIVQAKHLLPAILQQTLILAISGALSFLLLQFMYQANQRDGSFAMVLYGNDGDLVFAGLLLGFSLVLSLMARKAWKTSDSPLSYALGMLLVPALLGVAAALLFPAGSYLFSLPVLAGLLALVLRLWYRPLSALYAGLACILFMLLYVPVVVLFYMALGIHATFLVVPIALLPLSMFAGQVFLLGQDESVER